MESIQEKILAAVKPIQARLDIIVQQQKELTEECAYLRQLIGAKKDVKALNNTMVSTDRKRIMTVTSPGKTASKPALTTTREIKKVTSPEVPKKSVNSRPVTALTKPKVQVKPLAPTNTTKPVGTVAAKSVKAITNPIPSNSKKTLKSTPVVQKSITSKASKDNSDVTLSKQEKTKVVQLPEQSTVQQAVQIIQTIQPILDIGQQDTLPKEEQKQVQVEVEVKTELKQQQEQKQQSLQQQTKKESQIQIKSQTKEQSKQKPKSQISQSSSKPQLQHKKQAQIAFPQISIHTPQSNFKIPSKIQQPKSQLQDNKLKQQSKILKQKNSNALEVEDIKLENINSAMSVEQKSEKDLKVSKLACSILKQPDEMFASFVENPVSNTNLTNSCLEQPQEPASDQVL